jgi:hypothetical protein
MTKEEIIAATFQAMAVNGGLLSSERAEAHVTDEYESLVRATLAERLPEADFKTCEDFKHLNAECCPICHTFYAHYDMYLEDLPGGEAWICCSVRSALFEPEKRPEYLGEKEVDLKRALRQEYT